MTKNCLTCQRSKKYVEGCSHVDCPQRRPVTAQIVGERCQTPAHGILAGVAGSSCIRREPTTKD